MLCQSPELWKFVRLPAWIISISWVQVPNFSGFNERKVEKIRWNPWGETTPNCYRSVVKCCIAPGWGCTLMRVARKLISLESSLINNREYMGVSKNTGTPKWMVYTGSKPYYGWFGKKTIFGNTHISESYLFSPMPWIATNLFLLSKIFLLRHSACKNVTYFAHVADGFIYTFLGHKMFSKIMRWNNKKWILYVCSRVF